MGCRLDLALAETHPADTNPSYPNLTDLQRAAIRIVQEIGYSQRVTDDVLGFIKVRLSSLRLGTTGRFLQGGHQLDFGKLLRTTPCSRSRTSATTATRRS